MNQPALDRIASIGIIPVIRADAESAALLIAEALIAAGLDVVEITMTVPNAIAVMTAIAQRFGASVTLGAGTVTTHSMAVKAADAGCSFLVTPCVLPDVVAAGRSRQLPVICGAMTPTEILAAHDTGAALVKVFPSSAVGGPAYFRAIRGPLPHIGLVATGGVGLDTVADYFAAGVVAVGVGGELILRSAVAAGDYAAIGALGRRFVAEAQRAREKRSS
jgi:2-dehydro-3-deoxyphosphogluconate aldolase/(4S)-4-hydroxy-2-oxoglutarate aldolase